MGGSKGVDDAAERLKNDSKRVVLKERRKKKEKNSQIFPNKGRSKTEVKL